MPGGRRYTPFRRNPERVPGRGPQPCDCTLIGEKPGLEESTSRPPTPFVGPSGQVLNTYLSAAAIDRQAIYVTNCVKEFTQYSKPTKEELDRDKPELIQEIIACSPRVIGLVGAYAVTHVLGWEKADMDRRHGIPMRVQSLFGGELTYSDPGWIVIPLFHPAGVLHSPDSAPMILDDYLQLGKLLDGEIEPIADDIPDDQLDYRVVGAEDLDSILPPSCTTLDLMGIDTEGNKHKDWSVQFSIESGQSFLIRGGDREALAKFFSWLKRVRPANGEWMLSLHHALHDLPQLRSMGIYLEEGSYRDTMIWAYLLACEPLGLKPLAYRHAGMLQDSYDDIIGDVGWSIAMEYLCRVADKQWPEPGPEIIREGGVERVKRPHGANKLVNRILDDIAKGKVNKDGEPVDPRARWKNLSDAAKAPVIAELGDMRDPDLDDIPFARASRYALRDSDAQYRITRPLEAKIKAMGLEEISKVDHDVLPMVDRMMSRGAYMAPPEFWDQLEGLCERQMSAAKWEIYKLTGRDLNPASGDQVADLLYGPKSEGGMELTPLMLTDGGATGKRRGSTNDKCLEDLMSQAPVVEHIQSYREADKLRGTYVEPLREASRTLDRRAHTTFKVTRQVTGRITTAEPINLLSIPVRGELGSKCRDGFEAPPDKVLYDADMNQIELRLFAHESRDKNLCRAFIEGIDLHAMTASGMFGVGMNQVEKYQRQAGKIVNFAIINMITPTGLLNQMILYRATKKDGTRWTEDDCAQMIEAWFGMYPDGRKCQQRFIEEARATGFARESIAGRIRYLPNIWSNIRHIREAAERDAQFPIQAGAASILKKSVKVMWDGLKGLIRENGEGVEPVLLVHDEALWESPDREYEREAVERIVKGAFENTVKLRVPITAAGKFGNSWGSAH